MIILFLLHPSNKADTDVVEVAVTSFLIINTDCIGDALVFAVSNKGLLANNREQFIFGYTFLGKRKHKMTILYVT